ncbi:glutathione synthase [Kaarinaea lacus]
MKLGAVMDPIGSIKTHKDSTFAMLLEAQARRWQLYYMEMQHLYLQDGECYAWMQELQVKDDSRHWYQLAEGKHAPLAQLDAVLMRKDPPVTMEYMHATQFLDRAEAAGVLVINKPSSLRDANEKLFTAWFPQCVCPTIVTSSTEQLRGFLQQHQDIIVKPLDAMGGASIFRVKKDDPNTNVIFETITGLEQHYAMAQTYLAEIAQGDKRILMINGEPIPYALARIPAAGETRGNLAVGGKGVGVELSERDYWICEQVAPVLREKGLIFTGLDVIGDYLTEINVTSPTCIRELDALYNLNISAKLMDFIEAHGSNNK